jgi:NAD dependent epimerase/dehydratase family enzyme
MTEASIAGMPESDGDLSIGTSRSPNPEHNAEFAATLSRVLGKKPGKPMPSSLLRLMIGEMAGAFALSSRRKHPHKQLDTGYGFRYPLLADAVSHELHDRHV